MDLDGLSVFLVVGLARILVESHEQVANDRIEEAIGFGNWSMFTAVLFGWAIRLIPEFAVALLNRLPYQEVVLSALE